MKCIDADVHNVLASNKDLLPYLPKVWHEHWLNLGTGVGGLYRSSVGRDRFDAVPPSGGPAGCDQQFLIAQLLNKCDIDYAILTGDIMSMAVNPDPDYVNAVFSAYNDWLADTWLRNDNRFKGSININPFDPSAAALEIDRMAGNTDMVQVIMTSGSSMLYGQRFFHPIYEAAARNGLPVAIHPGAEGKGISGSPTPSGYPTRYMEWHNILPTNFMGHINSLVCEGVFEKFPELKVVGIEGGVTWLVHLMWRMDKNYKALRDTAPWLKRLPSEYIKDHIRLTTQPIEEPAHPEELLQIFKIISAETTILFSSDYPHWDFDNPKMTLPKMPREMKEAIMFKNAAKLYGLQVEEEKHDPLSSCNNG